MVRKEESLIGGSCPHGGGVAEKRMVMEAEAPVLAPRCPLVVEAKGQKTDPQLFTLSKNVLVVIGLHLGTFGARMSPNSIEQY